MTMADFLVTLIALEPLVKSQAQRLLPLLRFPLQANNIKMRKVKLWISVQILAGVWYQASGSPGGAPTSACSTLVPGHGADIQDTTFNPYELTLDVNSVEAGQPVKLTLQTSNSSENETLFRGFLIKAQDSLKQPVGVFSNFGSDAQALSCDGVEGSATTHTSREDKTAVTMDWSHPNFDSGESKSVTFLYSVVKTFDTYWANEAIAQALTVTSNVATESTASKPDPETVETTEEKAETSAAPKVAAEEKTKSGPEVVAEAESGPEVVAEAESEPESEAEAESEPEVKAEESNSPERAAKLNQNECGSNKGCFGMPTNCEEAGNCKVMLTYAPAADDNFRLELQGRSIGSGDYMSCGLSLDDSMGGDLVLACLGGTSLKAFWNKNNAKSNVEGVTGVEFLNPSFSSENGLTKCSFDLNPKINAKLDAALNEPNFNLDLAASNFHVLLAEGAVSSSKLTYHTTKVASSQPVDFQSVSKVAGSTDVLIRVHGILMVLAWMACASSGMFMARYFKEPLPCPLLNFFQSGRSPFDLGRKVSNKTNSSTRADKLFNRLIGTHPNIYFSISNQPAPLFWPLVNVNYWHKMNDIPWVPQDITGPEEWSQYAEKILRDTDNADIQPSYGDIAGMLECSCPSPEHHEESRALSSPLLPCWFVDPRVKYQFGILSCLKHVRPSEEEWRRLLKPACVGLFVAFPSLVAIEGDEDMRRACYFVLKGLDSSNEATQLFLFILDLANLLRLWDWKLSTQEMLRLLTSEWALLEDKHGLGLDQPASFSHPVLDLPLKVKQMRYFIQSLAMDLIYLSYEPPCVILKNLPYLMGQAICPLWNLIRPWPEFVHGNNFLDQFKMVFKRLLECGDIFALPVIQAPSFQANENSPHVAFWRLGEEKLQSGQKCVLCWKKIAESASFLAARSPAKCIYPRDVPVSKPGQPVIIDTVCSYSCHLAIGDHFKHLTWTDRRREKLCGDGNVDTNGVTFFRIRYKLKNPFPTITHRAFLNDANWIVTLRHPAKSVFSNSLYKDLTRLLKDRQERSQPLVQKLLKDEMDFINGNFLDRDEDLTFLQDELSHLADYTTVSEDLGSIRCFWQRSWLPVGIFAQDNVDDVLVVSHFVQEHPCHYVGRKQVQEVLELLVLEREFLVLPITKDICDIRDAKMGALFLLRRPKFQNDFSPASLKSGRWYLFARRLDSKTRNCVGGFFMPCPSEANSWIGILVPDMFDGITRVPRLDATVQRLASFQKSNFKVHEIAKASIFISNKSIRRDETNHIKKTVFYIMGLMLHRDACEKGLAPKLDNKVKMIPFKMVLPNANFIDCTIVLNFVFMTGHQFLPVIQHISQKMDWIFKYNFTIEEEREGSVPKEWIVQEEHFREEKFDRFKINTKFARANEESHLPRVNKIWTKSTKIVFDGELLVYRMHVYASLRPTFRAIVLHDFVLSDILEMDYFDSVIKPRRERKRWHFFYICGGAKPFDLSGMEDHTIEEIARTVGHIGCHFYVFVTDDVEDVLTDGLAPPQPFPMFSKSHHNHALQNKNHKVLMWTGSLIIPMEEHETPFGLSGWLIHEDGNFKNPKYWQTFFKSLHPQTLVLKGRIAEFVVQDLIKNSTMFSFSVAPIWAGEGSDLDHVYFTDIFRQTIRAIFGDGLKHQYALVVNIPGKEPRSGILLRDESGIGCRFYVPNDSKWTQRHFVSFNIPFSNRPLKSKISGSTSFKPNKKCYILGTFKAVLGFRTEVCDIPIYMVAKTHDPNISSDRLNFTNICDEFTGSHLLVPLFRREDCTLTSSMKELGFILGSSTASITAAFKPDLVYCDTMMPRPFDLSYFGALFFFQGSLTELRHHLCHQNYPEVAKRSFIAKTDASSEPLTVFLFHYVFMLTIVQSLVPLVLSSTPLCQCYRKKREFEIFVDIQKNEARRLWEDFDEREQFRPIMKQTKRGKPPKKSKPSNDVTYPGMLELFHEEKSKVLANMGNNESDDSCTLEALYQAQEHVQCFAPASRHAEPKTNSDSEAQQKENSVPDSSCPKEFAGKDTPTSNSPTKKSDPKTTEKKSTTLISENQREGSISASQETVDQGFSSPLLKPMGSIFQHTVSPEARNNVLDEMIRLTWTKLVDNEEPLRVCDNCGREEFDMKVCNTCRASFFCNNKCFKRAQKTHKKMCAQIVNQRLNLVMEVLRQPQLPKL